MILDKLETYELKYVSLWRFTIGHMPNKQGCPKNDQKDKQVSFILFLFPFPSVSQQPSKVE